MLGPQRMNLTRWIAMKFGTDIYVHVRMNYGNALIIVDIPKFDHGPVYRATNEVTPRFELNLAC